MTNQDYKNAALASLRGNWAPVVVTGIVYMVITCGLPALLNSVDDQPFLLPFSATYLVLLPLEVGFFNSFRCLYQNGDLNLTGNMFSFGFKNYVHVFLTMLVLSLAEIVGMILLIIPGIILTYAYAMVPFILVTEPELNIVDTLRKSRKMMKGHKFDFFYLQLSFIGWILLGIFTLGIGLFWIIPYVTTSYAAFWQDVSSQYDAATPSQD